MWRKNRVHSDVFTLIRYSLCVVICSRKNSRHETPSLVSPRNNVWETNVEVMCHYPDLASVSDWSWRVGNFALINQKNYLIWLLTHHQKNLFARSSDVISQGNHAVSVSRDVCFFLRLRYRVQEFHLCPLFWQTVSAPLDIRFVKLKECSCCFVAQCHLF